MLTFFRDPDQQRSLRIEDHLGKPLMFRDPYPGQTELVKIPEKIEEDGENYLVGFSTGKNGEKIEVNLRQIGNTLVVVREPLYAGIESDAKPRGLGPAGVMYPFTAHSSNGFRALQELRSMIDDADARAIEIQLQRGLDRGQRVRVGQRESGGTIDVINPTLPTTPVDQDGNPIDPSPTTFDRKQL